MYGMVEKLEEGRRCFDNWIKGTILSATANFRLLDNVQRMLFTSSELAIACERKSCITWERASRRYRCLATVQGKHHSSLELANKESGLKQDT